MKKKLPPIMMQIAFDFFCHEHAAFHRLGAEFNINF